MQIINGKAIAQKIIDNLKLQPKPNKIMVAILVGNDPTSVSFLKQKEKVANELGLEFKVYGLKETISENELLAEVKKISESENVGGIIIQLPLPDNINRQNILNIVPQEKDVDVLNEFNQGHILPPAVGVVEEILKAMNYELRTKKVAVVGLGFLVGKPISEWLKDKCAELYLLDIESDLSRLKNADLVISGVGKAGLIKPGVLKDGATVIDFGYSIKHETWNMKRKICGDLDVNDPSFKLHASGFYTPTPGGTGPILVAKLFENFYKLNS